jgi:predicted oxidoreductase
MQDEIARSGRKTKIRGKIVDFGLSNFTNSQTELIRQKQRLATIRQFSATNFEPMVDGSFDYMQLNKIRPMSWNPLGFVFRKISRKPIDKKILATLVSKYHLVADTFYSWVLKHPLK